MKITATVFYSFQICPREAWFYYHNISSDKENPYLSLGRLIHETSYKRDKKEIMVDNKLKIDIIKDKVVAEIKKSSKFKKASILQLAYYLYYLKKEKGINMEGLLLFPEERKVEKLVLTPELENEIEKILKQMKPILTSDTPPPLKKIRFCNKCAFREFCWER